MRTDGFYWVQDLEHGSRVVLLYNDGEWNSDPGFNTQEKDVLVLVGPLAPPTPEDLARQETHFATRLEAEWKQYGCDPRWDGRWLQGFYWVQREGVDQPEIALTIEGSWGGLDWDEDDWSVPEGAPAPKVLIGPLDKPAKTLNVSIRWGTADRSGPGQAS